MIPYFINPHQFKIAVPNAMGTSTTVPPNGLVKGTYYLSLTNEGVLTEYTDYEDESDIDQDNVYYVYPEGIDTTELPALESNEGKVLTNDGTTTSWVNLANFIAADLDESSGKFLSNDGEYLYWRSTVADSALLSDLDESSGKFLSNDGSNIYWDNLPATNGVAIGPTYPGDYGRLAFWVDTAAVEGCPDVTYNPGSPKGTISFPNVSLTGGLSIEGVHSISTANSPYTVLDFQVLLLVNASGGAVVINLPFSTFGSQRLLIFKKIDAEAYTVTITPNGNDKIDGQNNKVLTTQWECVKLVAVQGIGWLII